MTIKIEEIDALLRARGYQVIHQTTKNRGFQLNQQLPLYLNLTSKSGKTALIAHPESGVAAWRDELLGMQVGDDYYHSSNMRHFPKRRHTGENLIPHGWGLTFTSATALAACLDRLEGQSPVATPAGQGLSTHEPAATLTEGADMPVTAQRRVGHDQFRALLLECWGSCAVTGLATPRLLRASHIKPWASSTPVEKTDPFNGLLLAPHLDAAFDAGLIAFDEQGGLLLSPELTREDAERLGLHAGLRLREVDARHLPYLAFHRQEIFIR
jgi:putative restriction endonuclease